MKLKYLVIHCTATPRGREVTADEIRHWHTDSLEKGGRGWKQIGYTYLIHLNGLLEQLVKNNDDEIVDSWEITNGAKGFNSVSQHIAYVGGVSSDTKKPEDTRTIQQLATMECFVKRFRSKHPDVRIVGHNELNNAKACPSFDVQKWLLSIGIKQ